MNKGSAIPQLFALMVQLLLTVLSSIWYDTYHIVRKNFDVFAGKLPTVLKLPVKRAQVCMYHESPPIRAQSI